MAARLWLRRAIVLERFYELTVSRNFCLAAASVEKTNKDVLPKKNEKKKKEKDLEKMAVYEDYRNRVNNLTVGFKDKYEAVKSEERRRLEEINQGSFSPYEQHKKAVEDIRRYNENKETVRKGKEEQREKRLRLRLQKEKEASDSKRLDSSRETVLKVIEESKSFVTLENLEEKIQEVLLNETNYNFAITLEGRKITSKEPPNNLGVQGPGPLAYQAAGLRFFNTGKDNKDKKESWKTRTFEAIDDTDDSSESSNSDSSDHDDVVKNFKR